MLGGTPAPARRVPAAPQTRSDKHGRPAPTLPLHTGQLHFRAVNLTQPGVVGCLTGRLGTGELISLNFISQGREILMLGKGSLQCMAMCREGY